MRYLALVLLFLFPQTTSKKFVGPQLCQDHRYSEPYITLAPNEIETGTITVLQVDSFYKTSVQINVGGNARGSLGALVFSDGKEIARCAKIDPLKNKDGEFVVSEESRLSGCYFENGGNLDSVMNAWLRAVLVSVPH